MRAGVKLARVAVGESNAGGGVNWLDFVLLQGAKLKDALFPLVNKQAVKAAEEKGAEAAAKVKTLEDAARELGK